MSEWFNTHFLSLGTAMTGLAITVPAVILFYFLKLRRKEEVIGSTLLWRRALEDLRVNAPFQKLKGNLLLLLQLLILLGLGLALSRPFMPGLAGDHKSGFVLLIDNSASMNTRDVEGQTRLAAARNSAIAEIEKIGSNALIAVVSFASQPVIVSGFSSDPSQLKKAVAGIKPTGSDTDLSAALKVADGMAGSLGRDSANRIGRGRCRLVVFSDAALPEDDPIKAPFLVGESGEEGTVEDVELRSIGQESDNFGITSFEARRSPGGATQVFVRVANWGREKASRDLRIFALGDSSALDVKELLLEPGQQKTENLSVRLSSEMTVLRAELSSGDALADDDVAWAVLPPSSKLKVLAYSDDLYFLKNAIRKLPLGRYAPPEILPVSRLPGPGEAAPLAWQKMDLVIFDGCVPSSLPVSGGYFFIAPEKKLPLERAGVGEEITSPGIVDWDHTHALTRFTSFGNLLVAKARPIVLGHGQINLLETTGGAIVAAWQRDNLRIVTIGFDLYESNWPLLASFPIFFVNSADWLAAASPKWSGAGLRCGEPLKLDAALWAESVRNGSVIVSIKKPDNSSEKLELRLGHPRVFSGTEMPGVYSVSGGSRGVKALFGCAVLSNRESRNRARDSLKFAVSGVRGASWQLAGNTENVSRSGREIWKYFAIAALALMLIEWHVYNRRMLG
jgi:VWA domain-containing protein/aerotolerance regulator-like protein